MARRVEVRFSGDLTDLLAPDRRHHPLNVEVGDGTTVKDLAESCGVPHTQIDVILVNGEPVGFGHQVADGDRVSVHPTSEGLDVPPHLRLLPKSPRRPRFVLDVHLGRLARTLRLLGFDAVWRNDIPDDELAAISTVEHRILLTRDRGLLKRAKVAHGYLVTETDRHRQVGEVLQRFDLAGAIAPFGRCLACNGLLEPVAKNEVEDRLPPRTRRDYDEFRRCTGCGRIYWQGSHYDRLAAVVEEIRRALPTPAHDRRPVDQPP